MDPFIGEIRLLPFTFPPQGYFPCDGRKLSISSYQALAAVIGNTYGGDNKTYFNLPNLQGLSVLGVGQGPGLAAYTLNQASGVGAVTLNAAQTPSHNHILQKRSPATLSTQTLTNAPGPANALSKAQVNNNGVFSATKLYAATSDGTTLSPATIGTTGGQAHDNHQPNVTLQFCIAWDGVFPVPD